MATPPPPARPRGPGRGLALVALVVAVAAVIAVLASTGGSSAHRPRGLASRGHRSPPAGRPSGAARSGTRGRPRTARPEPPFPVGHATMVFVDHSRTEALPGGARAYRRLRTLIFYPRLSRTRRSFPLLVFGHGFAVTPLTYGSLLRYWAAQGFVVAAPFFPLESHNAPGGPNESDLPNQPGDVSFLISRMLRVSATSSASLHGLINPRQIAVSGQSDGGDTALAVAYGGADRDRRVKAAVILSGEEIPGDSLAYFPPGGPPLLAVQGTADTINPPAFTYQFFSAAPPPKYLLTLPGEAHLPPYQRPPGLGIVERVTVAFLRRWLEGDASAGRQLSKLGNVPGRAHLSAYP